jgi:hypothetical protein
MPRSSNEDQVAANLVEVSIYGITTLYEKFDAAEAKKETTEEPVSPTSPKEMTPMPKEVTPMPKDGTPMAPKDTTPMPPKK